MSQTSFIDLTVPFRRDFADFFLKRNPFPSIGVPEENPLITVDREREIRQFRQIVTNVIDNEKSALTVLVGEYGSGKSHLFKIFKENINRQLFSRDNGTLAVYVKNPGDKFLDFLLGFIDEVDRSLLQKLSSEVILEYLYNLSEPKIREYLPYPELVKRIIDKTGDMSEIFPKLTNVPLIRSIINNKITGLKNRDVAHAFLNLPFETKSSLAWKWFLGYNLSSSDRDSLLVNSNITSNNAYNIFINLKTLFNNVGVKTLAIFIDELENIASLRSNIRDKYEDDIRQMIDDCPKNTIFYFAIAPRQWKEITSEPSAFVRRLSGNWLLLGEFEEKDIEELIERYLYSARSENFSSDKIKQYLNKIKKPSLYPFTQDSFTEIQNFTEGVVSRILLLCRKSLDYLHDHKETYQLITPELVKEAFHYRG